ncbi:MAG: sulfurtransferase TusA family protein [Snowella sp.]|nr:sulfurtransferase TusA family protein [Snowella sp.]
MSQSSKTPSLATEPVILDLRGTPCPINFVRTKLKLAQMSVGQVLEVWLDPGEPIEQVPPSLIMEGYTDQKMTEEATFFKLTIRVPDNL